MDGLWWMTILQGRSHLGEELRRRLLLNLLPRPLLILWVQSDLAMVHCPSINRTNSEGETNKQTSGGGTCGGADAGGGAELCNMQSPIHNASEYMEELRRCIGDVLEKRRVRYTGLYSDITPLLRGTSSSQVTHMAQGGGRGVVKVEVLHNVGGIGQVLSWEPLIIGVWPSLELHQVM